MSKIKKDWETKAGLKALVVLANRSHHCGYVQVSTNSPLKGVDYDNDMVSDIEVHGGLTFSGRLEHLGKRGWWLGYDCAHFSDKTLMPFLPKSKKTGVLDYGVFRDVDFCVKECELLAEQIVKKQQ